MSIKKLADDFNNTFKHKLKNILRLLKNQQDNNVQASIEATIAKNNHRN